MGAEKKRPREEETPVSPRKSPRLDLDLDLLAAAAVAVEAADSGCEASNRGEEAAAPVSDVCDHLGRTEDDTRAFVSNVKSFRCTPRCGHYLCEAPVQKSSILVCTVCNLHFCVGDAPMDNPQGHARWHANLEHHWVALWLNEPEELYCFQCDHALVMDAIIDTSEMKEEASNAVRGERCQHFSCNEAVIDKIISGIRFSKGAPKCKVYQCAVSGTSRIMVCTECNTNFCYRADLDKRPKGHARQHARQAQHWVALWDNDPYVGYCFACQEILSIGGKNDEGEMVVDDESDGHACELAKFPVWGMPNLGNTCYLNALLQCLLVLGKLRERMSGTEAPSGIVGAALSGLFEETDSVNNTGDQVNPMTFLACVRVTDQRFASNDMQDSHELLCSLRCILDKEEMLENPLNIQDGAPTAMEAIFGGHLSVITSCKRCSFNSVSREAFYDLSVPLPSKKLPPKIAALPPTNISNRFQGKKIRINLKNIQTISEGVDSQVPGLEPEDVVVKKTSEALKVDSTEVKQIIESKGILHGPLQTQKDEVQGEIVQVPPKTFDFLSSLDVKDEEIDVRTEGSHSSEDIGPLPFVSQSQLRESSSDVEEKTEVSIEAEKNTYSAEGTAKGKGKAQISNSACDEAENISSIASIEECMTLHLKAEVLEWTCQNCTNVDQWPSTNRSKDSCPPAEKQTNLLSEQDQNASMLNQGMGKRVKLDHTTHQAEENINEEKDRNKGAIQTRLISKLPPVLVIHLKRSQRSLGPIKMKGHVSFKEILGVGQFIDPSSDDKDNSSYRLVGVVEHRGLNPNVGHWVAYVRASQQQPNYGSSSWFYASDKKIKQVSLDEVLKCEAYLIFYERLEG